MCDTCKKLEWPALKGVSVVIGTTASIALYRIPDLIRELNRGGSAVHVGMSWSSAKLVSPEVMKWASGNEPIVNVTGDIEHIRLFDDAGMKHVLVLAPASYNVIGKVASGISDTVPSLFFAYAFGHGVPVVIAPAMHRAMLENSIMQENLNKLKKLGVDIVDPEMDPEKAKLSDHNTIIDHIYRAIFGDFMKSKRVLVISGGTEENIDPVRVITNRSTGTTGYWLTRNSFRLGAGQTVFVGNSMYTLPRYSENHIVYETDELYRTVEDILDRTEFDLILVPAAISDFSLKQLEKKADSEKPLELSLKPRPKLLDIIRKKHSGVMVAYRLNEKEADSRGHFANSKPDFTVFNKIGTGYSPYGESNVSYSVKGKSDVQIDAGTKEEATFRLLAHISRN